MSFVKKILSFFKNIHFQSLLGNGVMAVFGLLTSAILFRALSVDDIGVYFYLLIFYNLVDTIKAGFLTNAFITFYSGTSEERKNEIAGSSWTIAILISAGLIIINIPTFFIARYVDNNGLQLYLKYFSVFAISTLPSFMANLVVQGERRFDQLFWLRLINQLLFIASIILLMVLKKATFVTIMAAFTITNFMASFILVPMGWTKIGSIKYTTRKMLAELFHFGKYSVGTSLSTNLFRVTDSLFIQNFLGAPALALYNLGSRWMPIVEIPMLSFAASGIPILAGHYNNSQKDEMKKVMEKLVGMLSVAVFVIAVLAIIFADPLVLLVGGHKYIGSIAPNLFRIFITTAVLFPTDRFFAMTVDVIKKPHINFYKLITMLAINLIGDFVSVTYFHSLYAVVITNFFPLIAAIIITYIPLQKYYKFNFWNMYIIGYNEIIILIRNFYHTLFKKSEVSSS
jgi:O-antigen/teichoic acid export membrane protein